MKLTITNPKAKEPIIAPGRHFLVAGNSDEAISPGSTLVVELFDHNHQIVRKLTTNIFQNQQLILPKNGLTLYPENADPGLKQFKTTGFLPLLVQDNKDVHDYTQKAYYDQYSFKALIPSASRECDGACFPDGFGFTDQNGQALIALKEGDYQLRVTLYDKDSLLAQTSKNIKIGANDNLLICRFNPQAQKERIVKWASKMQLRYIEDDLPGYLNPYLGVWYYHMGLLTMYRSCDLAEYYHCQNIHLFLYNLTADSTSYASELALLQNKGVVDKLHIYHYVNGENGPISEFLEDEYLKVVRLEYVKEADKENCYDLYGKHEIINDDLLEPTTVGLHIIVKPIQLAKEHFILQSDNTYQIKEEVSYLRYCIDDGSSVTYFQKEMGLERFEGESIGKSVFEAFHIFKFDSDKHLHITIEAFSNLGRRWPKSYTLDIITKSSQSYGYIEV